MTTTAVPYNSVTTIMAGEGLEYLTADIAVCLATSSYTPSVGGHSNLTHISSFEPTDTSYDRVLLAGKSQTFASNKLTLYATDTTFPSLIEPSFRYAIFAKVGASDAASPLIGYWDLGANQAANANDFLLIYNVNGFLTIER